MTDTTTATTFEVGDKVRIKDEHRFLGRVYTTESAKGSVGVIDSLPSDTYVSVKWESHPEGFNGYNWSELGSSNVDKASLEKVEAEPTGEELNRLIRERIRSLDPVASQYVSEFSIKNYVIDRTCTPHARWVSESKPFVRSGDIIMLKDSEGADQEKAVVLWTEFDAYENQTMAVYFFRLGSKTTAWNTYGYTIVEKWNPLWGDERTPQGESARNPEVEVGDTVTVLEWLVETAPAIGEEYKVVYVDSGSGRPVVQSSRGDTWTATGWTLAKKGEPGPIAGDKVKVTGFQIGATDRLREFVRGLDYMVLSQVRGDSEFLVMLPEGKDWPDSFDVRSRSIVVTSVEKYVEKPEPEWKTLIQRVLEEVHQEACDNDWCEEYEITMREKFGIETEPRSTTTYRVEVSLERSIDPDNFIEAYSVFDGNAEGNVSTSSMLTVTTTVFVDVGDQGNDGPDRDDVENALDSEDYTYDSFTINDYYTV